MGQREGFQMAELRCRKKRRPGGSHVSAAKETLQRTSDFEQWVFALPTGIPGSGNRRAPATAHVGDTDGKLQSTKHGN